MTLIRVHELTIMHISERKVFWEVLKSSSHSLSHNISQHRIKSVCGGMGVARKSITFGNRDSINLNENLRNRVA